MDPMYMNPEFQRWADAHKGQYGDGLTSFERRLAWSAWLAAQDAMRKSIRESGDIPPR